MATDDNDTKLESEPAGGDSPNIARRDLLLSIGSIVLYTVLAFGVILALNATVEGQTTAHYLAEALENTGISVTRLAQGVPIGGELDYLDDGTISAALRARRQL